MKHALLASLALATLLFTGCRTLTDTERLAIIQSVAAESSYVGAAYAMQDQPELRASFQAAVEGLNKLVDAGSFDPVAFRAALGNIPALQGSTGALLDAGASLYSLALGFVQIDTAPRVQACLLGVRNGLQRALDRPQSRATPAQALPPQCKVPTR